MPAVPCWEVLRTGGTHGSIRCVLGAEETVGSGSCGQWWEEQWVVARLRRRCFRRSSMDLDPWPTRGQSCMG